MKQYTSTNEKGPGKTVAISLAAWPTFDQLSCNFRNIGGLTHPIPPINASLPPSFPFLENIQGSAPRSTTDSAVTFVGLV